MFALKDNLRQCNIEDVAGYKFNFDGDLCSIVNIKDGEMDFLDSNNNFFTKAIADISIEHLFNFNNWVYENVITKLHVFVASYFFPVSKEIAVTFSVPYTNANGTKVVNFSINHINNDEREFGTAFVNQQYNEYFYANTYRVYLAQSVSIKELNNVL